MKRKVLIAVMVLVVVAVVLGYLGVRALVRWGRETDEWLVTLPAQVQLEIRCEDSGQTREYCDEWAAMLVDQHTETVMTCWGENDESLSDFWECVTVAGLEP